MKKRVVVDGICHVLHKGKHATVRLNRDRTLPCWEVRLKSSGKITRRYFAFDRLKDANALAETRDREGNFYGDAFYVTQVEREALAAYRHYQSECMKAGSAARPLADLLAEALDRERKRQASTLFKAASSSYAEDVERAAKPEHVATTQNRIATLNQFFGDIRLSDITPDLIRTSVDSLQWHGKPISPTTRNQYYNLISAIFNKAIAAQLCTFNPAQAITRYKVVRDVPGILTPAQAADVLRFYDSHERSHLAEVVLGLFAGLRAEERVKIRMRDLHLDDPHPYVRVSHATAKTGGARDAWLEPCAVAWLRAALPDSALADSLIVPPGTLSQRKDAQQLALKRCKAALPFAIPQNAFRHSAASYLTAFTENMAATALRLGHSESILSRHYRALVSRQEAEAFFNIWPACAE